MLKPAIKATVSEWEINRVWFVYRPDMSGVDAMTEEEVCIDLFHCAVLCWLFHFTLLPLAVQSNCMLKEFLGLTALTHEAPLMFVFAKSNLSVTE